MMGSSEVQSKQPILVDHAHGRTPFDCAQGRLFESREGWCSLSKSTFKGWANLPVRTDDNGMKQITDWQNP